MVEGLTVIVAVPGAAEGPGDGEGLGVGLGVGVGVGEGLGVGLGVAVGFPPGVGLGDGVGDGVGELGPPTELEPEVLLPFKIPLVLDFCEQLVRAANVTIAKITPDWRFTLNIPALTV